MGSPECTPPAAFPSATTPPWTVRDLDRHFRLYAHEARYGRQHSAMTIANRAVSYKNVRAFLASRHGEDAPLPHPFLDVPGWLAWNGARGTIGPTTLRTYFANVRAFTRFLVQTQRIADPFAGVRAPVLPTPVPKAKTPAECQRILDTVENYPWPTRFERVRAVAIFALALFAGLRKSELRTLLRNHVNLDEQTVLIKGKGRGGGKERLMFISPDLHAALSAYIAVRDQLRDPPPEFFVGTVSGRGLSDMTLTRMVRRIRRSSGVPFTMHALRHSFITQLLRSGVPIHVASRAAGHTQLSTTAGYLRVWDDDVRKAVGGLTYD